MGQDLSAGDKGEAAKPAPAAPIAAPRQNSSKLPTLALGSLLFPSLWGILPQSSFQVEEGLEGPSCNTTRTRH